MCNDVFQLYYQNPEIENSAYDLNALAVKGIMSIGGGFDNWEEFWGSVDILCMAEKTYQNRHDIVANGWQQVAIPLIEVVVDVLI